MRLDAFSHSTPAFRWSCWWILLSATASPSAFASDGKSRASALPPSAAGETTETDAGEISIEEAVSRIPGSRQIRLLDLLNRGSLEDLCSIHGIATNRAKILIESRPIFELREIVLLPGFGPALLDRILSHDKFPPEAGSIASREKCAPETGD